MSEYQYAVVDRPGWETGNNRSKIWSRHTTLEAARRQRKKHTCNIPGNGEQQSAMIVDFAGADGRHTHLGMYLWSDALCRHKAYPWTEGDER